MNYMTVDFHRKKHRDWVYSFIHPMFVLSIAVNEGDKRHRQSGISTLWLI